MVHIMISMVYFWCISGENIWNDMIIMIMIFIIGVDPCPCFLSKHHGLMFARNVMEHLQENMGCSHQGISGRHDLHQSVFKSSTNEALRYVKTPCTAAHAQLVGVRRCSSSHLNRNVVIDDSDDPPNLDGMKPRSSITSC